MLLDSPPASASAFMGSAGGAGPPSWTLALRRTPDAAGPEADSSDPEASSKSRRGRLALGVGLDAGASAGMHNLHPLLCTLKSDDHSMLPVGVTPSGPEVPEYVFPLTMR